MPGAFTSVFTGITLLFIMITLCDSNCNFPHFTIVETDVYYALSIHLFSSELFSLLNSLPPL